MTTESQALVSQSEEKVTQGTENQVRPPETRSGASAVASRITHRITADTKAQSVSCVSKQAICSLNVLANRPPKPKKDRQHVCLAEDSEELGASDSEDGFHASIFTVESKTHHLKIPAPAVKFPVRIEDVDLQMEVDTGAAASIMNYTDYARYFKYLALRPVNKTFHTNTGTPLDIAGQIFVDVEYNGQQLTLPLLIVRAKKCALPLNDEDPPGLEELALTV